jgi:RNA polymerase sigma-70 factor (ECF subfamily)
MAEICKLPYINFVCHLSRLNQHTDQDLLRSIAEGDEIAFNELFTRCWPSVYDTCLRLTKSSELAKDLSQDIFVKLWTHRRQLPEVRNLSAFLYTVSRNLIFNHFQKKVLTLSNIDFLIDHFRHTAPDAQDQLEYKDLEGHVQTAINRLPERVREVFVLHREEGLNHDQISKRLNISVVSSKTYIVRALKEIRAFLSAHIEGLIPLLFFLLDHHLR